MMKTKFYVLISIILMMTAVSCSDNDDNDDPAPKPVMKKGYVSRLKVSDLNNPGSEEKTVKVYYDAMKRVTGIHWGTTVANRTAWKIEYSEGRADIQLSGDAAGTKRYCFIDASGKASDMFYDTENLSSHTLYTYSADRLTNLTENFSVGDSRTVVTDFTWTNSVITGINTVVRKMDSDSLTVTSSLIYDEFAPNNSNIDFNLILDAMNGMAPTYTEVPMVLGMCGSKPSQLVLRHSQNYVYAADAENNKTLGYEVLSYSMQQGRITSIEVENKGRGTHNKIDVIYKADE